MSIAGQWIRLDPETLARLPDDGAVYELGSLVRNVIFIGGAPAGELRQRIARHINDSNRLIRHQARYFRYESTPEPVARLEEVLEEYRIRHRGLLPPGQDGHVPFRPPKDSERPHKTRARRVD